MRASQSFDGMINMIKRPRQYTMKQTKNTQKTVQSVSKQHNYHYNEKWTTNQKLETDSGDEIWQLTVMTWLIAAKDTQPILELFSSSRGFDKKAGLSKTFIRKGQRLLGASTGIEKRSWDCHLSLPIHDNLKHSWLVNLVTSTQRKSCKFGASPDI